MREPSRRHAARGARLLAALCLAALVAGCAGPSGGTADDTDTDRQSGGHGGY